MDGARSGGCAAVWGSGFAVAVTGSCEARDIGRVFCPRAIFPAGTGAARGRMDATWPG